MMISDSGLLFWATYRLIAIIQLYEIWI